MTTFVETRPSTSDGKQLYRRCICRKCSGEHWHRQTGPHEWKCGGCGAIFTQNPWVSDGHPLIEKPKYEGDKLCQKQKSAQTVKELEPAPTVTETGALGVLTAMDQGKRCTTKTATQASLEFVPTAMVQAAFL